VVEKVAIPILENDVAPCFEVAHYFAVIEITDGRQTSRTVLTCSGCEGYGRVRFLMDNKIDLLICNGIKLFYRDLVEISGLKVISDIAGSVESALAGYISGKLQRRRYPDRSIDLSTEIPHDDLVCWARELFESNGYEILSRPDRLSFLIDLVAVTNCPLCRKSIKVGVCCGAHTYRLVDEIMEFHHVAPNEFHVKVYVYPSSPEVCEICTEYGIELIDPNSEDDLLFKPPADRIPVLRNPVRGHEKACLNRGRDRI
jgi:predicted Fe-Mo cluster-binding NifX family protein